MLLVYTQKITPRITYIFKHICTRILGIEVSFTSVIEELISYEGPKLSYGKQPLGNELFIQSYGLLTQQGIDTEEISVRDWDDTKCFFSVSDKSHLPFDIFSAGFFLLSRYEEYLPHVKDAMGRFPANESLGFKFQFLREPVVDIWAYKFKEVLRNNYPIIFFPKVQMEVLTLTKAQEPYAYNQRGAFRSLVGYARDILKFRIKRIIERTKVVSGFRRDPYNTFKWILNISRRNESKLIVFFLLGETEVFQESINTHRQKFKMLLKYVADYKEVGLIFSYTSLTNYELLKIEKQRMEAITNRTLESSINANYMVNLPEIYRNLVELEVKRDFTMVYEDTPGFRAGTCTPFLFYDLDYEIKTPLIIHPLVATTTAFKGKFTSDINKTVDQLWNAVKKVNGTFSMLFTNKDFTKTNANEVWRNLYANKLNSDE